MARRIGRQLYKALATAEAKRDALEMEGLNKLLAPLEGVSAKATRPAKKRTTGARSKARG